MRKKIRRILVVVALLLQLNPLPASAQSSPSANCKLANPDPSRVNVGIPVTRDRLGSKPQVTVMVAPFEFQDTKFDMDLTALKSRDTNVASLIKSFSRDRVTINFRYASSVIKDKRTAQGWGEFLRERHTAYSKQEEAKSTYGVVREWLAELDKREDLSGVDSVLFQSSLNEYQERQVGGAVYEAFMMNSPDSGFLRPYRTAEGEFFNAVIMTGVADVRTAAHELMHNFGLVDLYGYYGPDQAGGWSLMSSNEASLFNWEFWQLGWLKDEEVACFDVRDGKPLAPQTLDLTGFAKDGIKMLVLRTSDSEVQVAEVRDPILKPPTGQLLLTYSVGLDRYPGPIRVTNGPVISQASDLKIGVLKSMDEFELLVADAELGRVRVGLWSPSFTSSAEATLIRDQGAESARKRLEASTKPKVEDLPQPKKITITCVKGKTVKKVTGVSPKCPSGYKRK